MAEIGSNIVSGIWNGISSGWDWLTGEVKSLAKSLLDGAKDALGIHSPSRLFRDLVGKMIPQGIGVGITAEMPTLQSDLKEELQGMTTKVAAEVNPVTAVKNTAKISTIGGEVSTKQIAKDRDITVIVYTTNGIRWRRLVGGYLLSVQQRSRRREISVQCNTAYRNGRT